MTRRHRRIETSVIHDGYDAKEMLGSLTTPLFQTSTYTFETAEQGERRFSGEEDGYIYSRLGNPTVAVLEERIASLENGERDRKSTRLNSSHVATSYAVFCLKKKTPPFYYNIVTDSVP